MRHLEEKGPEYTATHETIGGGVQHLMRYFGRGALSSSTIRYIEIFNMKMPQTFELRGRVDRHVHPIWINSNT
jgi:hypothetical protein